jgi:hypothetical protein
VEVFVDRTKLTRKNSDGGKEWNECPRYSLKWLFLAINPAATKHQRKTGHANMIAAKAKKLMLFCVPCSLFETPELPKARVLIEPVLLTQ